MTLTSSAPAGSTFVLPAVHPETERTFRGPVAAVGWAVLLHALPVLLFLQSDLLIGSTAAQQAESGAQLRATLVAGVAPPKPVNAATTLARTPGEPLKKPVKHIARQQQSAVVATEHAAARQVAAAGENETRPAPSLPSVDMTQRHVEERITHDTASAAPTIALPSAQSARSVAQIACVISKPPYPPRARRLNHEGNVLMGVTIGVSGRVEHVEIVTSSGFAELDTAAREAMFNARCQPYRDNGIAISVQAMQPLNFKLDN